MDDGRKTRVWLRSNLFIVPLSVPFYVRHVQMFQRNTVVTVRSRTSHD